MIQVGVIRPESGSGGFLEIERANSIAGHISIHEI
jgi:hypothetical protein